MHYHEHFCDIVETALFALRHIAQQQCGNAVGTLPFLLKRKFCYDKQRWFSSQRIGCECAALITAFPVLKRGIVAVLAKIFLLRFNAFSPGVTRQPNLHKLLS